MLLTVSMAMFEFFRAYSLSMTCDESYSFTRYIDHPYLNIIFYRDVIILPNNHVLNTIGMKFLCSIFGNHPFYIRLPNLIAFSCYCLVFLYWIKKGNNRFEFLPNLIFLFFNPYLLDFFVLARGYGMGVCLMMMSLISIDLLCKRNEIKTKLYFLPLILAALSVWANFAFLNFYLGLLASVELLILYRYFKTAGTKTFLQLLRQHIPSIATTIVLYLLIRGPMGKIIEAHQLYGGTIGFWSDTVQSLINRTFYEKVYPDWVSTIFRKTS